MPINDIVTFQAKAIVDSLRLDLDDQLYFYVEEEEEVEGEAKPRLSLLEGYKVRPDLPGKLLDYGSWTSERLRLPREDLWQRRKDMQVGAVAELRLLLYK